MESMGAFDEHVLHWFLMFTLTYIHCAQCVNGTWHINPQSSWLWGRGC